METQFINSEVIRTCLGLSSGLTKLPASHVWIDYDKEADVLYLSFRKPQQAKETFEINEDVLLRTDGNDIVGLTIMNASSK